MGKKIIFSIGIEIPHNDVEHIKYDSKRTLIDADIIVFLPYLPPLNVESLNSAVFHWKDELLRAFESGKTIIVYLPEPHKTSIGINTFRSSYHALPVKFRIESKRGKTFKAKKNASIIFDYWKTFKEYTPEYEIFIHSDAVEPLLTDRSSKNIVGGLISNESHGNIILLPPLEYDDELFWVYDTELDYHVPSQEGAEFGNKFVKCIVEIDKALHRGGDITPTPEWVNIPEYKLKTELEIETKLKNINEKLEKLQKQSDSLQSKLVQEGGLRRLLYENGTPLEEAVHEALTLLGYSSSRYIDDESEYDAILVDPENRRLLGEVEGKDNSWINIDKFRQLEGNIHEDYNREGVDEHAHGILFGNAYRLKPVNEREDFFTNKCLSSAARYGFALVRTPDLFLVAKYIKETGDFDFAKLCRDAISNTKGKIVEFPPIPKTD